MRGFEDDPLAAFARQSGFSPHSAVWALKRAGYPPVERWPMPEAAIPPQAQVWDFELHASPHADGPSDTVRAPTEPPVPGPPGRTITDRPGADEPPTDAWHHDPRSSARARRDHPTPDLDFDPDPAATDLAAPADHAEFPDRTDRTDFAEYIDYTDFTDPEAPPLEEPRATVELPAPRPRPHSHRRQIPRTRGRGLVLLSRTMVVLSALVVGAVVVLGVLSTLAPMASVAATAGHPGAARWWPFLIHGPWLVAALSLVRAGIHHRRAVHSWLVIAAFAALSMALSISYAPRNMQGIIVAVLPAAAMTACLHQLVRQITLNRPSAKSDPEDPDALRP